jgi:hypothetical protein
MSDVSSAIKIALRIYRLAQRRVRVIGSTAWPMANGRIFDGAVVDGEVQSWAVEIAYSYSALGEYYSGTFRRDFMRKKSAEAFLERLPRETPIPVRYKPESPEISTVLISDLGLLLSGL